jgi:putative hydrolase of the HAD superfamily
MGQNCGNPLPSHIPATLRAVVLDLSGVITTHLKGALTDMLRAHHLEPPDAIEAAHDAWARLYREASLGHISPEELWSEWRRRCDLGTLPAGREEARFLSRIHLREPDIPQTLAALRERHLLGLLSNHVARWGSTLLERFALRPFFDTVVFSSQIGARKPLPLPYEQTCTLLQVPPEQALYVADEEEDLVGCQAVGMFPVFVPGEDSTSQVGLLLNALSDLPFLL